MADESYTTEDVMYSGLGLLSTQNELQARQMEFMILTMGEELLIRAVGHDDEQVRKMKEAREGVNDSIEKLHIVRDAQFQEFHEKMQSFHADSHALEEIHEGLSDDAVNDFLAELTGPTGEDDASEHQ